MQMTIALAAVVLLALAGCQSRALVAEPKPQRIEKREPKPVVRVPLAPPPAPIPMPTASERALAEGIGLYDAGDFNGAIKRLLGAKEIWDDSTTLGATANKLAAHKYLAFSYCVTNRRTQCRQQFVNAIKLDPNFNLEPAEKTHPVWGPEFERAKKQAMAPATPARRPGAVSGDAIGVPLRHSFCPEAEIRVSRQRGAATFIRGRGRPPVPARTGLRGEVISPPSVHAGRA